VCPLGDSRGVRASRLRRRGVLASAYFGATALSTLHRERFRLSTAGRDARQPQARRLHSLNISHKKNLLTINTKQCYFPPPYESDEPID